MKSQKETENFKKTINRQRIKPRIWDYSYFLLKNNFNVFKKFRSLIIQENRRKILDVGCGFKPWLEMFDKKKVEYIGVDFNKSISLVDFVASSDKLPFADGEFDALIYSEVLEHVSDLQKTLNEMRRVAKNNALVFISSPFVFPEHGIPYDFQRLTQYFYRKTFENDEIILIKESNSSFSTMLASFNLFVESSPFGILKGFKNVFYCLTNIIGIFGDGVINFIFSRIGKSYKKYFYLMPLGYALIIRIKK